MGGRVGLGNGKGKGKGVSGTAGHDIDIPIHILNPQFAVLSDKDSKDSVSVSVSTNTQSAQVPVTTLHVTRDLSRLCFWTREDSLGFEVVQGFEAQCFKVQGCTSRVRVGSSPL